MLDNSFVELLVLLLALLKLLFVVDHHFLLLPQDLLDDLVLVLAQLIHSVISLKFQLRILLFQGFQALEALACQRESFLFPRVANLDQVCLFLVVNHTKLVAAAGPVLRVAGHLALQLANHLSLLFLLGLQFRDLSLQLQECLALAIDCRLMAVIVVFADKLLCFEVHVADVLDLRKTQVHHTLRLELLSTRASRQQTLVFGDVGTFVGSDSDGGRELVPQTLRALLIGFGHLELFRVQLRRWLRLVDDDSLAVGGSRAV